MGVFIGLVLYLDRDKEEPNGQRTLASYTVEDAQNALLKASRMADGTSKKTDGPDSQVDDSIVKPPPRAKIPSAIPKPPQKETIPTLKEIQEARSWARQMIVKSGNLSYSGGRAKDVDVDVEIFNRLPINEQHTLINQVHGSVRDIILRNIAYERRSALRPSEINDGITENSSVGRVATYLSSVQGIEQKRLDSTTASTVVKEFSSLTPPDDCLSFHAMYASFLNAKARGADEATLQQQSRALETALRAIQQSHTSLSEEARNLRINP